MASKLEQLIIRHKRNAETHKCEVTDDDYRSFETNLKLLGRLSEIENSTISVRDLYRNNYILKSSKFRKMVVLAVNTPFPQTTVL